MKNKKVFSFILSLSMVFGTLGAVPAHAGGSVNVHANHKFIDIAHHGNTYVAMTKNNNLSAAKLYTSTDGGMNWTESMASLSATISNNKASQQQLVYWADKNVFVAHGDKETYTSTDGITWTANANIHWKSSTYLAAEDKYLLLAGDSSGSAVSVQDNLEKSQYEENKNTILPTNYIFRSIAAKPKDSNGDIYMYTVGSGYQYYVKMTPGSPCTWKTVGSNSGGSIPTTVTDMIYAKGADQFLAVTGDGKLYAAFNPKNFGQYAIKDGVNVTGIAANDNVIVAGMADGTMYYTANTAITADTQWTQIPVESGRTAAAEPIKNIEFSDDGSSFVALGEKNIYKGNLSEYCNIKDYVPKYLTIGEPTVKPTEDKDPFKGVRLIGGTYSETLGKYIVYGDTTSADSDDKYYGKIFTSSDGFNWTNTYTGYTFSQRNYNDDGVFTGYSEVRNGAVWWESQRIFIVSASTKDHMGYSLTSPDGVDWNVVKGYADEGDAADTVYTGLALNADIRIAGGNLYTTDGARKLMKYTAWNKDYASEVADVSTLSNIPKAITALNQIAVSDEADPAVLMAQAYLGVVRDNSNSFAKEINKWSVVYSAPSSLGIGNGDLTDAVYSKNLGKFVAVVNQNFRTVIVPKAITDTDKAVQGPVVKDGVVCNAIDTNDSVFMLTSPNGKIYTGPDSEEFLNKYSLASNVVGAVTTDDEITYGMTNVFKTTGDRFIATASNGTDSAVAVIDKNIGGSYKYKNAVLHSDVTLTPGEELTVSVAVDNQQPEDLKMTIIAAIYTDGKLVQTAASDLLTVSRYNAETKTLNVPVAGDIESGSEMRVFVWNGMQPLKGVSTPFN